MLLILLCVINFLQLCLKINQEYRRFVRDVAMNTRMEMVMRRRQYVHYPREDDRNEN